MDDVEKHLCDGSLLPDPANLPSAVSDNIGEQVAVGLPSAVPDNVGEQVAVGLPSAVPDNVGEEASSAGVPAPASDSVGEQAPAGLPSAVSGSAEGQAPAGLPSGADERADPPKENTRPMLPYDTPLWEIAQPDEEENGENAEGEDDDDIDTVELFDIVPGEWVGGEQEPSPIVFALQKGAALRLAKESALLLVVAALLSSFSFGFISLYFWRVLSWPSAWSELPAGYASWTSCHPSATRPAATALGQALPYNTVSALLSVPKIFEFAFLVIVVGGVMSRWHLRASTISGLVTLSLAMLAAPTYIGASGLRIHAMPNVADPLITVAMVVVTCVTHTVFFIRSRRSSSGIVGRCPKLFSLAGLAALFVAPLAFDSALLAIDTKGASTRTSIAVWAGVVLLRLVGFLIRCVLRGINAPVFACFALLFIYQTVWALKWWRYVLALPGIEEVALAACVSAVINIAFNAAAAAYAVRGYNGLVGKGCLELGRIHFNIFLMGVFGDLIAEHVGLHSGLAYSLYLDTRILPISVQPDGDRAVEAWALSFAIELAVDVLILVPLLCFLPARVGELFRKHLRSMTVVAILICSCVHANLAGLNFYLQEDRYFCH